MIRELGQPIDCPNCTGTGKVMNKLCPICRGDKRVEYQEAHGEIRAPAGSWMPTQTRGRSGWRIVIFGGRKTEATR